MFEFNKDQDDFLRIRRKHRVAPRLLVTEEPKRRGRPKNQPNPPVPTSEVNDEKDDVLAMQVECYALRPHFSDDIFIVDTGCIGSHIFKDDILVSNLQPKNTSVQDFSGSGH